MMLSSHRRWVWALLLAAVPAVAQDRLEIQVYDSQTAPRHEVGLELHLNFVGNGSRTASPDGELPTYHVGHLTFEPHFGLTDWAELGAYLQTAVRPEGSYEYAGVKLRLKARWPRKLWGAMGLSLNVELSSVPGTYEANRYGSELRPTVDAWVGRFYGALNPIVSIDLGGPLAGRPQLQPAAKLAVRVGSGWAAGVEYYAGLGPADGIFPAAQQSHRLFGVWDFEGSWFDLNVGAGYGWGAADRWVFKAILGFHPPEPLAVLPSTAAGP